MSEGAGGVDVPKALFYGPLWCPAGAAHSGDRSFSGGTGMLAVFRGAHALHLSEGAVKGAAVGVPHGLPNGVNVLRCVYQQILGVEQSLGVDIVQNSHLHHGFKGAGEMGLVHLKLVTEHGQT